MKQAYPTFIFECDDTFLVHVPDMDIYTEGANMVEAIEMARDAIGLKGIDLENEGEKLPEPSNKETLLSKVKDTETLDYTKGILTYVDIDFIKYRKMFGNRSVSKNCTIPKWLNTKAEDAGINFSEVLREALLEKLGIKTLC